MTSDPIVAEVDAIKAAIAAEFNFDTQKMIEDAIRKQTGDDGHPLISRHEFQRRKLRTPVER